MIGAWKQLTLCAAMVGSIADGVCGTAAEPDPLGNWPAGVGPREIGVRVAENFAARKFDFQTNPRRDYVIYPEACAWYGSLTIAEVTGNRDLQARLIKEFELLLTAGSRRISPQAHVDYRVFGVVPLEIYLLTKDPKCLELGKSLADQQWEKSTPDGLTAEARYWIDDMYMITGLQMQAYRATQDVRYLDRAALTMTAYLDKLQQPNGLFYHAPDSPFFWSRGNGWVAAGMTELLRSFPADRPQRARILESYQRMMAALLKYQGEDGLWRQLIDHADAWPETSGTGMFTFAMVTGVRNGWLDPNTYGPAARKAWLGLVKHLDSNANVGSVCEGTDKGKSVQYYLDRKRNTGDLHGQAPILWTASALMR
jgi:unsaturated rhamnogalacturonyl hydrolase